MERTYFQSDSGQGDRIIEAAIRIEKAILLVRAIGK
jgi:hypothetical protein